MPTLTLHTYTPPFHSNKKAGSAFLYTYITFGQLPALLVGINLLVDYHVAAALIARSFSIYLAEGLRHAGLDVPAWVASIPLNDVISISVVAPLLLLALTAVLIRGAEFGAWVNIVLTLTKMVVIVLVCAVGLLHLQVGNWAPFFPHGIAPVFQTTATVFFSYVGFDTIASSSEEANDPLRYGLGAFGWVDESMRRLDPARPDPTRPNTQGPAPGHHALARRVRGPLLLCLFGHYGDGALRSD